MLTNQYPRKFGRGEGWEVLLERDVIPIRDRNPDLPAPLAIVIDRALHEGSKTSTTPTTASSDKNHCTDLPNRMTKAKITSQQVDQVFYQIYPDRVNQPLADTAIDRALRQEWCVVANKLIESS